MARAGEQRSLPRDLYKYSTGTTKLLSPQLCENKLPPKTPLMAKDVPSSVAESRRPLRLQHPLRQPSPLCFSNDESTKPPPPKPGTLSPGGRGRTSTIVCLVCSVRSSWRAAFALGTAKTTPASPLWVPWRNALGYENGGSAT